METVDNRLLRNVKNIKIKVRKTTLEDREISADVALSLAKKAIYGPDSNYQLTEPHLKLHDLVQDNQMRIGLVTALEAASDGVIYKVSWMTDVLTDCVVDEEESIQDNLGILLNLVHRAAS